ncbi:MAG: hypothetical protein NC238_10560 [Dehalobacter sp.]|nr:hypothetical protein [Dehalobacter sp.]
MPLCGHGSAEVEDLPAEPIKTAVTAEIEARPEKIPKFLLSTDNPYPEVEAVAENEPPKTEITSEEKTEPASPAKPTLHAVSISAPATTELKPGTIAVIDDVKSMWIPGFGWVKDEGSGSVCITVDGEGDINMQVGIMGGDKSTPCEKTASPAEQPKPAGDIIYIEFQPAPTKVSTPPPYKPGEVPPNL